MAEVVLCIFICTGAVFKDCCDVLFERLFSTACFFFTYVCEPYSGAIQDSHCICMYFSEQWEFHSNFEQFLMDLKTMQGRTMVVIFVKICKHSISFTYMYFALLLLLKITNEFRCTYSCEGWGRCMSF